MKILLIIAMDSEAEGIVSGLNLKPIPYENSNYPCSQYSGKINNHEIFLQVNGRYPEEPKVCLVGTEPGTLSTYMGIEKFKPDLLINLGTAGGKKSSGIEIGDTIMAKKVYFHDRQVGIPGYKERSIGNFTSWERSEELAKKIQSKFFNISSGNSFELNDADKKRIEEFESEAKDMEAASIAWVASLSKIPFIALKSITDFIDVHEQSSQEQFFANLKKACDCLAVKTKKLLEAI